MKIPSNLLKYLKDYSLHLFLEIWWHDYFFHNLMHLKIWLPWFITISIPFFCLSASYGCYFQYSNFFCLLLALLSTTQLSFFIRHFDMKWKCINLQITFCFTYWKKKTEDPTEETKTQDPKEDPYKEPYHWGLKESSITEDPRNDPIN